MATPAVSDVYAKGSSEAFYFVYQWVSDADGRPTIVYVDEVDTDGSTVLASTPYWLAGAVGGGPPIRTPVAPLSYAWQTGGPKYQMRRAPYPDPANPLDTWAGTLINSSARVAVFDAALGSTGTGGGGSSPAPLQNAVLASTADADVGTVSIRNLWLPEVVALSYFVHPTDTTPLTTEFDYGSNYAPPDDWFRPSFTGSGAEALGGSGWINPVAFAPGSDAVAALVNQANQLLPSVQLISGRDDGLAYPGDGFNGEIQLIRHLFTLPTFVDGATAQFGLYCKGRVLAITLNGNDVSSQIPITYDPPSGTSLAMTSLDMALLRQGESNLFALAYALNDAGGGASLLLPYPDLARAQFVGYALTVNS